LNKQHCTDHHPKKGAPKDPKGTTRKLFNG
jgi:hypothetical protein